MGIVKGRDLNFEPGDWYLPFDFGFNAKLKNCQLLTCFQRTMEPNTSVILIIKRRRKQPAAS
ncbi:MAG TPA: hypothetical protein DCR43_02670 [Bacteroidales bacterium]|nr:MAG: hypothetical protein A2X11_07220 [Bacteroidetes bacterium GWE2_42_24]OFY29543.1 MAG: hypothetical protein A2X09_04380 [Bacteroidetes bacterium GWF2_43_11]PKP18329.1 MAG: hypothetical protein CVU06_12305 [Bacteroidetes bacterium HGW-Bacteroidetes-22]HAQ64747.1 hypothetical protein [Bacteroidales bacterium]HBZ67345.1 hypothetical protein [Bacteroidales bacterium]